MNIWKQVDDLQTWIEGAECNELDKNLMYFKVYIPFAHQGRKRCKARRVGEPTSGTCTVPSLFLPVCIRPQRISESG
jgi:hypothetical protein